MSIPRAFRAIWTKKQVRAACCRAFALGAALVVAACGSMNVQVDVLDPEYAETTARLTHLRHQLRQVFQPDEEKARSYQQITDKLARALNIAIERYAQGSALRRAVAERLSARSGDILADLDRQFDRLDALDREIRAEVASQPGEKRGVDVDLTAPRLHMLLLQRQATAQAAVDAVEDFAQITSGIGEGTSAPATSPGAATPAPLIAEARAAVETITGGRTLTESPYAYAVANAPQEKWADQFNRNFGRGWFGNMNFAVKMNSLGDFSIKGVTFDPSTVAQVTSKVTTQSLLLAAQLAGVPVGGLAVADSEDGAALAARSAGLVDLLASNHAFAARRELRQNAIATILGRIGLEADHLRSEDLGVRREADRSIRASYEAYQDLLRDTAVKDSE